MVEIFIEQMILIIYVWTTGIRDLTLRLDQCIICVSWDKEFNDSVRTTNCGSVSWDLVACIYFNGHGKLCLKLFHQSENIEKILANQKRTQEIFTDQLSHFDISLSIIQILSGLYNANALINVYFGFVGKLASFSPSLLCLQKTRAPFEL